ncbi:MAG: ribbon-helix-helix domain-containing protein [Thaumarchaeota archaeon]|nr:ribbon-helix-helix domain-containing protein [Candidatus Calditenuaceae archaeon]
MKRGKLNGGYPKMHTVTVKVPIPIMDVLRMIVEEGYAVSVTDAIRDAIRLYIQDWVKAQSVISTIRSNKQ